MKVGHVAILGRPNSGKSTLMNACIDEDLAPVSSVANTTRIISRGIYTDETTQIVFIDAPGFQGETNLLSKYIRKETFRALKEADLLLRIVDVSRGRGEEDERIDELMTFVDIPSITVYTKVDLVHIQEVPENALKAGKESIPIKELLEAISQKLPVGDYIHDPDLYTDVPPENLIPEIIRSECFVRLKQEIPHSLYVRVEDVEVTEDIVKILAYIVVETESQKKIVIGKSALLLTEIATASRMRLQDLYGTKIFLQTRVAVETNWTKNTNTLKKIFSHA